LRCISPPLVSALILPGIEGAFAGRTELFVGKRRRFTGLLVHSLVVSRLRRAPKSGKEPIESFLLARANEKRRDRGSYGAARDAFLTPKKTIRSVNFA